MKYEILLKCNHVLSVKSKEKKAFAIHSNSTFNHQEFCPHCSRSEPVMKVIKTKETNVELPMGVSEIVEECFA